MAVSSWTSTDVERFDWMLAETARVLQPRGQFLFYGVHPCFNGPTSRAAQIAAAWCTPPTERPSATPPHCGGAEGIRVKAGGMRHLPLADFINAFSEAGLLIERVREPDEEPVPYAIVVAARKAS